MKKLSISVLASASLGFKPNSVSKIKENIEKEKAKLVELHKNSEIRYKKADKKYDDALTKAWHLRTKVHAFFDKLIAKLEAIRDRRIDKIQNTKRAKLKNLNAEQRDCLTEGREALELLKSLEVK